MFGSDALTVSAVDSIAHIIQIALTPVFLLSGIAALLGVFSTRLARVADRFDMLSQKLDGAGLDMQAGLSAQLAYLRRRSLALDVAVILGTVGGGATCAAAFALFVGALRNTIVAGVLFLCFGLALVCTIGALTAFLMEMLIASRGLRRNVAVHQLKIEADEAGADAEPGEAPTEAAHDVTNPAPPAP
jgi:hypothetical protein